MDVSVIIPVGRDVVGLTTTLQSIRNQHWDPRRAEVIVCNDGGGDAVSEVIAQFGCIEARLEENRGSYAARNAGIRIARGRALAFLDADELVTQGWLAAGLAALESADYVGGRIVVDVGSRPSFWERVDARFAFPVASYLGKRQYAPTANLFVLRKVVEEVGGFDEALRSGGDREFGTRVAGRQLIQRYCELAVTHHPARDFREQLRKMRRTSRGNARLEVMLWGRSAAGLGVRAMLFVPANLCYAGMFVARHLFRGKTSPDDVHLLAAGHAVVNACYSMSLAVSAFALVLQRNRLQSRVPAMARAP